MLDDKVLVSVEHIKQQQEEIERLREKSKRQQIAEDDARKVAREMLGHFYRSDLDDGPNLEFWKERHPWL